MEFKFFTIVFFLDIETAPLAKQVVTIIGNISGVKPTAMEIANKKASTQSFLVIPLTKNTMGTINNIKRIKIQETELTPLVKFVSIGIVETDEAIEPNKVLLPTPITTAVALPLITLLPMNKILL